MSITSNSARDEVITDEFEEQPDDAEMTFEEMERDILKNSRDLASTSRILHEDSRISTPCTTEDSRQLEALEEDVKPPRDWLFHVI